MIMAAFFDDKSLVAGINEDWDENTTGNFMSAEKAQSVNLVDLNLLSHQKH